MIISGYYALEDAKHLFDYGADRVVIKSFVGKPKMYQTNIRYMKQAVMASLDFISSNGFKLLLIGRKS